MATLERDASAQAQITAKLFYSTRYFAAYDLDADEFSGLHSGVDLKLARGTPVGAIAGGLVRFADNEGALGLHVMIEHQLDGETYFSIYGHLDSVSVRAGDPITPGQIIGMVGMTGNTTAPHLHLQVDRGDGSAVHTPYQPSVLPSREEIARYSVNPITFIAAHAKNPLP
jgi:murein DD-endopeptidase MepM/ murein hydrolase activator NlpD